MPHRVPSPAASELELDISKALFGDSNSNRDVPHLQSQQSQDGQGIPNVEASDSDDAAFIAGTQAASNRKTKNMQGKSVKKGGGFQTFGLNEHLLKAISRKGFSVPTPIQRKTIPILLDGQDVVAMARTGSGKTAAFVIPMVQRLKSHSTKVGARAIIMSPSRELALQTLKVVKELGRGTDLRCCLLVGGESLEEGFSSMATNPDILICTPGRLMHLKVEMGLDLSSVQYAVFDEADRLFEMGFAAQLTEILHSLPQPRQTMLFSATLPKSLVEFARAGLSEPNLIRLDVESKISPDLQSSFFTMKKGEKDGALLHLISDVIGVPLGETENAKKTKADVQESQAGKKRKRDDDNAVKFSPTHCSTLIFAQTKHHVEYLAALLRQSGFAVSYVYGTLNQTAREMNVLDFRTGMTHILVVTDVAARGIDIPVLSNVINYDFPAQPKIFVHRVGRTARAGLKGSNYNLVSASDVPYLLDLQLFLDRPLIMGRDKKNGIDYTKDVVLGSLLRDRLETHSGMVSKLLEEDIDLLGMRNVAIKGDKQYLRSRTSASSESARRAKEVTNSKDWETVHPLFDGDVDRKDLDRERMLARVSGFRPTETIFEVGKKGAVGDVAAEIMKKRRKTIEKKRQRILDLEDVEASSVIPMIEPDTPEAESLPDVQLDMDSASDDELEVTLSQPSKKGPSTSKNDWQSEFFMSYNPTTSNLAEDKAYGIHSGSNTNRNGDAHFTEAARGATMDLINDDGTKGFTEPSGKRWDKKAKKYVARTNDQDGSKGSRLIRGESGQKIPATFKSGRFDAWKKSNKMSRLPKVGEQESKTTVPMRTGKRFKYSSEKAPKPADKFRDDYHKRKKKVEAAKEKRVGSFRNGPGKSEIRGVEDVRKERKAKEKKREKTARPRRRGGKS